MAQLSTLGHIERMNQDKLQERVPWLVVGAMFSPLIVASVYLSVTHFLPAGSITTLYPEYAAFAVSIAVGSWFIWAMPYRWPARTFTLLFYIPLAWPALCFYRLLFMAIVFHSL